MKKQDIFNVHDWQIESFNNTIIWNGLREMLTLSNRYMWSTATQKIKQYSDLYCITRWWSSGWNLISKCKVIFWLQAEHTIPQTEFIICKADWGSIIATWCWNKPVFWGQQQPSESTRLMIEYTNKQYIIDLRNSLQFFFYCSFTFGKHAYTVYRMCRGIVQVPCAPTVHIRGCAQSMIWEAK